MKDCLVCYFSVTGTTKNVAEKVREILDCDIFEILPVEEYIDEDLDWNDKSSRSSLEMADENSRPKVQKQVENLDNYRKIVLAFPVWWYKNPSIINTFLDENNLENKEIYVLVTSGGSSVASSLEHLRKCYTNLNFVSGKKLNYITDKSEIIGWIR